MNPLKQDDDLHALLSSALIEATPPKKRSASPTHRAEREIFTKPENWYRVGQVQLIHRGSHIDTLLGLFDEMRHVSVLDVRRLVATSDPLGEAKLEYVTQDHWLGEEIKYRPAPQKTVELMLPIDLNMGQTLTASPVMLSAHLSHGGLSFLTLDADTIFHGKTPREILSLPKGMNVLEGLTHECRQKVWAAVRIEVENV